MVVADAEPPSPWIVRFADLVPAGGRVVDLACGGGRHTRLFVERGHRVLAVDRSLEGLGPLASHPLVEALEVDLEDGRPLPVAPASCDGVVVTRYLHRPLLPALVDAVAPGGSLLYETFAVGNERFGRPTNPAFLLRPGELLNVATGRLRVVAYEDLVVDEPRPAAVQRIAAVRGA
jgi:SAM-dependent methyltransferase